MVISMGIQHSKFIVKLGNGVLKRNDVVLFTPDKNIVVCEPKFESAFAIITTVSEGGNEVCLKTFDNREFQAIKTDYISYVDYRNVEDLIHECKQYCIRNFYNHDLQIVIDLQEEFEEFLERCLDDSLHPITRDDIGAMNYEIENIFDALTFKRDINWSCTDVKFLRVIRDYCKQIYDWYDGIKNLNRNY